MDTNHRASRPAPARRYKHHPQALKREVVEKKLQPGASVSRIARDYDVNANQVFAWRKAYREGLLGERNSVELLPVQIAEEATPVRIPAAPATPEAAGTIMLERDGTRVSILGRPDSDTLRLVLDRCLR